MVMCFVPDCKHYSERQTCKFFRFPRDDTLKEKWIKQIRRADKFPTIHSLVCSCHFVSADRKNLPTLFGRNKSKEIQFQPRSQRKQNFRHTLENSLSVNAPSTSSTSSILLEALQKPQISQGNLTGFLRKRKVEEPKPLIKRIKVNKALSLNMKGSPFKRKQHVKIVKDHTYCLSPSKRDRRKLKEEKQNVEKELETMEEHLLTLVNRVHHLQDIVSDLSKRKLISDDILSLLKKSYSDVLYSVIMD